MFGMRIFRMMVVMMIVVPIMVMMMVMMRVQMQSAFASTKGCAEIAIFDTRSGR